MFQKQPSISNSTTQTIWGISATIGNLEQAKDVLLSIPLKNEKGVIVKANMKKN